MYVHNLDPILLSLGPLEIRWYGLMYVLAFLVVYYYVRGAIRQDKLDITEKQLDNLLGLMVLCMIAGARLFYAIFYNPGYFLAQPWKLFFIWEGGLSFHGGLLGVFGAAFWYARKHDLSIFRLADLFVVPIALGNAFGRIGNFINGELYGIATTLPWGVVFPGTDAARHPTQLYEALSYFLVFVILFSLRNKTSKNGTIFGLFLILYAIFRFSIEFIKDLPLYGPLTMGQWLTIPMIVFGVWLVRRKT